MFELTCKDKKLRKVYLTNLMHVSATPASKVWLNYIILLFNYKVLLFKEKCSCTFVVLWTIVILVSNCFFISD